MRTFALALSLATVLSVPAFAQEGPPKPPAELARFERLIGTWESSGQVWMEAGAPAMDWTAKSRTQKVLDGFVLQEDMVIDLGDMVPVPMMFRSYMTYDTQTRRYLGGGIGNNGRVALTQIHFADDDTLVSVETMLEEGKRVVDQWVTMLGDGKTYSFVGRRSVNGGPFFDHVKGTAKRVSANHTFDDPRKVPAFMVEASAEMKKFNRMAGSYRMKGQFTPGPGAPAIPISAREDIVTWFGGTVLAAEVTGDPTPGIGIYKALAAFGWDEEKQSYVGIYFNNMGEVGSSDSYYVDGKLVNAAAGPTMGMPSANRGVITFTDNGAIQKVSSHVLMGTADPLLMFEATYTRVDG